MTQAELIENLNRRIIWNEKKLAWQAAEIKRLKDEANSDFATHVVIVEAGNAMIARLQAENLKLVTDKYEFIESDSSCHA